jgi:1-deoxy-D-xylulose-5-phosphate reductoisomerase
VRVRRIVILGSTGSIGTQALDIISRNPDQFTVTGLAATGRDPLALIDQCLDHQVPMVAVTGITAEEFLEQFRARATTRRISSIREPEVFAGIDAATHLAGTRVDVVLNGLAGAAGLEPTLAALRAGNILALANKESLIIGGPLVKGLASPGQIVPVDSEHSALAQCLRAGQPSEVQRLVLTASGGPFRGWSPAQLADVTPDQALRHPTWAMGPLVTINSATLMNKGLEVIEAHLLFDIDFSAIEVVVHPQSIVHSMVEFCDGSTIAQASPPDMRLPIAMGLAWPDRVPQAAPACDWRQAQVWQFEPLDEEAFPAVQLARLAGSSGGTAPAVFNGADEACVAAFLAGRLDFPGIVRTVGHVLNEHLTASGVGEAGSAFIPGAQVDLTDVLAADAWARRRAAQVAEQDVGQRG